MLAHQGVAQVDLCAPEAGIPLFWAHQLQLRRPYSGQNCSSKCVESLLVILKVILGRCEGPWCLSDFGPAERRTRAGRSGQAQIGHLRARYWSWPTPGVISSIFDAAGCHAGRQGKAAGLCKIRGANFS
eukprot:1156806-Pelagomonas_calceolata.AAC.3